MHKGDEKYTITLDLDRERIRTILRETYRAVSDMLSVDPYPSEDEFVAKVDPYLASNRVSTAVTIPLPCRQWPEFSIDVDLRRPGVFARFRSRSKQAEINRYLKAL